MIVSRLLCTNAVVSHGSGETLPLQWWPRRTCPSFQAMRPGKAGEASTVTPAGSLGSRRAQLPGAVGGDRLTL